MIYEIIRSYFKYLLTLFILLFPFRLAAYEKNPTSTRARGLSLAYHAFSDDTAGIFYNPALMGLADSPEITLNHGSLFFQNAQESAGALYLFKRINTGLSVDLIHRLPVLHQKRGDVIYRDGEEIDTPPLRELGTSAGLSWRLHKFFYTGAALETRIIILDDKKFYTTFIRGGIAGLITAPRTMDLSCGLSLEKELLANVTGGRFGKGYSLDLSFRTIIPAWRSEIGLSLGLDNSDLLYPYNSGSASRFKDMARFGIGIESFRDFIITPRFSIGIPAVSTAELSLSLGLGISIPAGAFLSEFNYAFNKSFGPVAEVNSFTHHFNISFRKNLNAFTTMKNTPLYLPERCLVFNELYSLPGELKHTSAVQGPDDRIGIMISDIKSSLGDNQAGNLTAGLKNGIRKILSSHNNISLESEPDLIIRPRIKVEGELMNIVLNASDRGRTILEREYTGKFIKPSETESRLDQVHYFIKTNQLHFVPVISAEYIRENNLKVKSYTRDFCEALIDIIEERYLKTVLISASRFPAEIRINDSYAGVYSGKPLPVLLKKGEYKFSAHSRGTVPAVKKFSIDNDKEIMISFPDDRHYIDLTLRVIGRHAEKLSSKAGEVQQEFMSNCVFSNLSPLTGSLELSGFHSIKRIPLMTNQAFDHQVNLMADFTGRFSAERWTAINESEAYRMDKTRNGIRIRGVGLSGEDFIGVNTLPFFAGDFRISFDIRARKKGQLNFTLVTENGRKFTLITRQNRVFVQSELEDRQDKIRRKGLNRAYIIPAAFAEVRIKKVKNSIDVYANDRLLYQGRFPENVTVRMVAGCENQQTEEQLDYTVENFVFNNL